MIYHCLILPHKFWSADCDRPDIEAISAAFINDSIKLWKELVLDFCCTIALF